MDRRSQGGLLLTAAVIVVLAGSRLLNPHVVDGSAAVEPPPAAPTVGSCLAGSVTSSWDAVGTLQPATTVYVSCDQPHRGEVFAVIDPMPVLSSGTVFDLCGGRLDMARYLGVDADGWNPEIRIRSTASGPDRRQVDAAQYWVACVLVDDVGPALIGPLAGSAATHTVPPQVGVCFDGSVTDIGVRGPVLCDGPHDGEIFGTRSVAATADVADLTRSCRVLVDAEAGRPVTDRDADLVVEAAIGTEVGVTTLATAPVRADATARCVIRSADDRRLTASLRQLGDAALPWAE